MINFYFEPSLWKPNNDCIDNVSKFMQVENQNGEMVEGCRLGNWKYDWSEIIYELSKFSTNEEYTFTFWIHGGENDRYDEVSELQIIYDHDYNNKIEFPLNRNYTKPIKTYHGYKLYEISFSTKNYKSIQLRFVAMGAILDIIPAGPISEYKHLPEDPDLVQDENKDEKQEDKKKHFPVVIAIVIGLVVCYSWLRKKKQKYNE